MPVSGKYEWTERKTQIRLSVALLGAAPSAVDIFVTATELKVNYAPYLIDIALRHRVDPLRHKAVVKDGVLQVTLFKQDEGITWGLLEADADQASQARLDGMLMHDKLEAELLERRKGRRNEDERFAVKRQMFLDSSMRERMDLLKSEEKRGAEEEVYNALDRLTASTKPPASKPSVHQVQEASHPMHEGIFDEQDLAAGYDSDIDARPRGDKGDNGDHGDHGEKGDNGDNGDNGDVLDSLRHMPPPRYSDPLSVSSAPATVPLMFTPRIFPTPLRESKTAEESDWVAKNRKHLKSHGVVGRNLNTSADVSENDPLWLKAKADDFYRGGDYMSAVNAYSAAIDLNDMPSCYSNRSACYLHLGQYRDCHDDCNVVLKTPVQSLGALLFVKTSLRKGLCLCFLGQFADALATYESALEVATSAVQEGAELRVSLDDIASDVGKIRILVSADECKRRGDEHVSKHEAVAAIESYSLAIALLPLHVGCLANRATCHMSLGDVDMCVIDCTTALATLQEPSNGAMAMNLLMSIVPPQGSAKRKTWVMTLLAKRGAALGQLGRLDEAIADYAQLSGLDPSNAAVRSDLNTMQSLRASLASSAV